jgi:stringent starvation protein B
VSDSLSSSRPYLFRAMHEWMTDNGQTPLALVDASQAEVEVPVEHIKDDRIVLNVAWSATRNLEMTNDFVFFNARFNGVARAVSFPMSAVLAIYARESGQGMQFQDEPATGNVAEARPDEDIPPDRTPDGTPDGTKRPGLRLVK